MTELLAIVCGEFAIVAPILYDSSMKEFMNKSVGVGILLIAVFAAGCVGNKTETTTAGPQSGAATSKPVSTETKPTGAVPSTSSVAESAKPTESAATEPYAELPPLEGDNWQLLFDGVSLDGWKVTDFAGHGAVEVKNGLLVLEMGAMLTGVNLVKTNDIPCWDYELALDAMKLAGQDFFCGLTFVVGDSCCSFIVGGWGGGLVGISSIDGNDASMNETTKYKAFEPNKWYRIRVRVTRSKLEAWIGKEKMVNVELEGKRITVRPGEIEENQPFGICTYQTTGAFRNIQWRKLK